MPADPRTTGWLVAVDVTGDGQADASASPLELCADTGCSPLGASDLDADGDGELVVMTHFSIVDHLFFSIRAVEGGYSLEPILVAEPGHRPAGIEPGAPLMTSAGGDAGYSAWIRCETYPDSPVLVFAAESSIVDSREPHEWHETKLRLQADGMFHVVGTNDLTLARSPRFDHPRRRRAARLQPLGGAELSAQPREAEDELVQEEHPALGRDERPKSSTGAARHEGP